MGKFVRIFGVVVIVFLLLLNGIMLFSVYKNQAHIIPQGALNENSNLLYISAQFNFPFDVPKEFRDEIDMDGEAIRLYEILDMKIVCVLGEDIYDIDPIVTEDDVIGAKIILEKPAGEYRKIDSIRFKLAGCNDVIREHVPIKNAEVNLGTIDFKPLEE